jgi:hypothetical protein
MRKAMNRNAHCGRKYRDKETGEVVTFFGNATFQGLPSDSFNMVVFFRPDKRDSVAMWASDFFDKYEALSTSW